MDERILLVEDDPSIREMTALGLGRAGYRVTTAADGREGLQRARHDPFDLVLLDVMFPTVDGFEICRQFRKDSSIPVIMLTAEDRDDRRRGGTRARGRRLRDQTVRGARAGREGPSGVEEEPGGARRAHHEMGDLLRDSRLVDVAVQRLRGKVEADPASP